MIISQKFDLLMIFLHKLFIEVELQMKENSIFNCALYQYSVRVEATKCSLFICHVHVHNKHVVKFVLSSGTKS